MSVDISWYAYSPRRADEEWKHFEEDLIAVARVRFGLQQSVNSKTSSDEDGSWKEQYFESLHTAKMHEIFRKYESEGWYIPGVEWFPSNNQASDESGELSSDYEKMEYLLHFGILNPKGHKRGEKGPWTYMYDEDKESYERWVDDTHDKIRRNLISLDSGKPHYNLSERQMALDKIDLPFWDEVLSEEELFKDFVELEVFYGSVQNGLFSDSSPQNYDTVAETYDLFFQGNDASFISDRQEWIDVYSELNEKGVEQERINDVGLEFDWDADYCEWLIRDFFRVMKPLAKFLKDNEDAQIIRIQHGQLEYDPTEINALLNERTRIYFDKYKAVAHQVWEMRERSTIR